jgi:hypothetical protein
MASAKRVERNAEVALVAMYRCFVTEGIEKLKRAEISERAGYKTRDKPDDAVFVLIVSSGWSAQRGDEFMLTSAGRDKARRLLDA